MDAKAAIRPFLICLPLGLSCVDKVDLAVHAENLPIVVDGLITDQPGPDTVRLSYAYPVDGRYYPPKGFDGATVTITDDTGAIDYLAGIGHGYYVTQSTIGAVGRTYQLTILLPARGDAPEETVAISTPQKMVGAGTIDSIFYEFTTRVIPSTGISEDGFNVFINSSLSPGSSRRMQWNFMGTYTTMTNPSGLMTPPPCAAGCQCCVCWYTTHERAPIVSNANAVGGSKLDRVFIQYIPINGFTFFDRYRVEITQMELSEDVFNFYLAIRQQVDNANSVFQPAFSEIKGNVVAQNGPRRVLGTFAASAVVKSHIYISRTAVPYRVTSELELGDCRAIAAHATLTMPPYWQ